MANYANSTVYKKVRRFENRLTSKTRYSKRTALEEGIICLGNIL